MLRLRVLCMMKDKHPMDDQDYHAVGNIGDQVQGPQMQGNGSIDSASAIAYTTLCVCKQGPLRDIS